MANTHTTIMDMALAQLESPAQEKDPRIASAEGFLRAKGMRWTFEIDGEKKSLTDAQKITLAERAGWTYKADKADQSPAQDAQPTPAQDSPAPDTPAQEETPDTVTLGDPEGKTAQGRRTWLAKAVRKLDLTDLPVGTQVSPAGLFAGTGYDDVADDVRTKQVRRAVNKALGSKRGWASYKGRKVADWGAYADDGSRTVTLQAGDDTARWTIAADGTLTRVA